jgi:nucleotide-binding universal stress UspA family protein
MGGTCRAVHVTGAVASCPPLGVDVGGTELMLVEGDPAAEIERVARDPSIGIVVVGARGDRAGPRPAGHVTVAVAERAGKPVVVVPAGPERGLARLERVLIPLEGTTDSSSAIVDVLAQLSEAGAVLIALHVFDTGTVPRFWDDPAHRGATYAEGFGTRWWPIADRVDVLLRRGEPGSTVVDVARSEDVDLIVLGWAQDLTLGHAAVVRAALDDAHVPVLLVPQREVPDPP